MEKYELYEYDFVLNKKYEKVDEKDSIDGARIRAKELAEGWCVDEEPINFYSDGKIECWGGNADFGIVIVKVNKEEL
ncbi:MAG: hypothetical protein PHP08_00815 [Candidatus Dojkabacteria bacterium]|nr:hypothetical protein [Candidatus Dojkabacteria bacterium]